MTYLDLPFLVIRKRGFTSLTARRLESSPGLNWGTWSCPGVLLDLISSSTGVLEDMGCHGIPQGSISPGSCAWLCMVHAI